MSSLTIRTRLTVTIVLLTAVISALGVLFGVRLLENQVRDAAIDERADQLIEFGALEFLDEGFAEAFGDDLESGDLLDDVVFLKKGFGSLTDSEFAETIAFAQSYAQLIPNFSVVTSEVGNDAGELFLWIGGAEVVAITETSGRIVPIEEIVDQPLVPINDLFDLGLFPAAFDDFESGLFGAPEPDQLDIEIGRRTIEGVSFAFLAEVSDELDALETVRNTLRNVVIVLTLLAGLATWFVAGRALRPVGAITDQVKEITAGTLSERVPEPKAADEVGVLARTMNTMLGRLENSDLRRRQFVSDASHELRTPVAVLRSEAEVARRAPDSTTIDDFASVVLGESKRLEGLVEDLLSLARGDEARSFDATAAIDVDEIVLAEAERTRALAVDKKAVSAGRVIGHQDHMHRVVAHLLDNAARHGESTVAVGVQTIGETVRIWVDDDGPGITEAERERIFGRFIRLDDARNRDAGGAGLGLAVVHETVARMNGTIEVLDSPLGGARFQIEFPAA
ncbi:MAG: signal transduction histidine kinase [Verrucomicrobiales bacterium]|jgi:signal transduction histidine kinase